MPETTANEGARPRSQIVLAGRLVIPKEEIRWSFTRSSGAGGQHVNKTATQAELSFDLAHSPSIADSDKAWLRMRLASRLDKHGILHLTVQESRSQSYNRKLALERFQELMEEGLKRPRKRKPTKPSRGTIEARLAKKRVHSELKRQRSEKF